MSSLPSTTTTSRSLLPVPRVLEVALRWVLKNHTAHSKIDFTAPEHEQRALLGEFRTEWTFFGASLLGLGSANVAIFALTSDSAYRVYSNARWAVAGGTIAGGIGILVTMILMLRFTPDIETFEHKATDKYGGFRTFALVARVPALCSALSAIFFVVFVVLASSEDHPFGTAVVLATTFLIVTSNFSIYGLHICITYGARVLHSAWKTVSRS